MRNIALTLLCAGLLAGNFGCGQKDDTSAATTPPPAAVPAAPPTTTPPTTGADATSAPAIGSPAAATPANGAAANTGATDAKPGKAVKLPDGLEYTDVKIGTGPTPQSGQTVVVHYTGTLTNGTKFDSSLDRNQPFEFQLGGGQVIKGWDEGVRGMKVGGVRKLVIPSELAYGKDGRPPVIPGSATLLFTIQLLEVK